MENGILYKLIKEIDYNISNFFFIDKEYQDFIEQYYREKYPYKYEEKIENDFEDIFKINPFLRDEIDCDDVSAQFEDTSEKPVIKEKINLEIEGYFYTPDYPDIGKFINLWFYDPENKSSLDLDFYIKLKLDYIYQTIKDLTIDQQKGIVLLLLNFVRKAIGGQDLIFLKEYFRNKFPSFWQDHYGDIRVYKKRAGSIIYNDLIKYYCELLEGNIDTRIIITQKDYLAILGYLKIIERGKNYEIQAKKAVQLIDKHKLFTRFKIVTSKEITILSYIKRYFSDPDKFELKPELVHILKDLIK